jgi:membrane protease subunit HflK
MPWSNQSGGGRNGGSDDGNQGGPWGQGPKGPGGGNGGTPPDLEDIIRKGQDQLRRAIPGGGGFSPLMLGLVFAGLLVAYMFKAVYTIQPDELGIELRFGKPKTEISEPGLHFHYWPIETYDVVNVSERQLNIPARNSRAGAKLMLSGDQNIVEVEFVVLYQVAIPQDYLFKVAEPEALVQQVADSAMREVVGRRPAQDIFRDNRAVIAENVEKIVQATLDQYGTGIQINVINIEDVAPPPEVADAFDEVQRAEQDEDRFIEDANKYSNRKLGQARGEAAQIREDAAAYKNRVVEESKGEAQRFISVYDEYAKAPEVTRKRLFLETMETVLRDSDKVILEQGQGQGVVPYLPLPEINKQRKKNTSSVVQGASQ